MIGSTVGRWTAFVEPQTTRSLILHLIKRSHDAAPGAVGVRRADGIEEIVDHEVQFAFVPLREGGPWADAPTLTGFSYPENDVTDFLRAVANEAARLGIWPDNVADAHRELAAAKRHLEDMRKLVFKGAGYEKLP